MGTPATQKRDITQRFSTRRDAERYRDRFESGRRLRTHERELAALRTVLDRCPNVSTVLDVGGGTGRFAQLFAERGRRVVQLDLSIHMLAVSRASCAHADGRCAHVQADVRRLPIVDQGVDLVFCHRLLNHLTVEADRRRALEQLSRSCRHYLVVSTLGPPRAIQCLRDTYDRWRGAAAGASRYVTPSALITELEATGMRLGHRVTIRAFPASAEFLIFGRN